MADETGRIAFDGILNFRDVGRSINHLSGRTLLKPGLFFRGARPDDATPSDLSRLRSELCIRTTIDLRTPTEHLEQERKQLNPSGPGSAAPWTPPSSSPALLSSGNNGDDGHDASIPPPSESSTINLSLNGPAYSRALLSHLSYLDTAKFLLLYGLGFRKPAISILGLNVISQRGLLGLAQDTLVHSQSEVAELFALLADPGRYPVAVNCTQGKDRTGLVVLLVLMLSGVVDDEAIAADYALSEPELEPEREGKVLEMAEIGLPADFADCPEGWAGGVCDFVRREFGGVERYLERCGVPSEARERGKTILLRGPP